MINLTMSLIASATLAAAALVALGVAVPVATFFVVKHIVWVIQGKPVKRGFLKLFRIKGKHKVKQGEYGKIRQPEPTPTPDPIPLPPPTPVPPQPEPKKPEEKKPFWPRTLKRIRVFANLKGNKWKQGEFKDAETPDELLKEVKKFLTENFDNPNVTSFDFTFADPCGRFANNFMEFNIKRGPKRPKSARPQRAEAITNLINEIEGYSEANNGVFTEEASKAFVERANSIDRNVNTTPEELAENATFIEDIQDEQRHARQLEAYQRLRQQMAAEAAGKQGSDDQKCK